MDSEKLRILLQVLDYGSITKTGEALGYSQSGITHIINNLERDLGLRLLNRGRNGITLTQEGIALLPLFREMVSLDEQMNRNIMKIKGLVQGEIRIGSFTSIALYCLPEILQNFRKKYPTIRITLMKGNNNDIEKWMEDGTVDFGFLSRQSYHCFDFVKLMEDPICAVMAPENPLAQYDPLPTEMLKEAEFLRYTTASGLDLDTERVLLEIDPQNVIYTTNFDFSLISMARRNLGVCLVPGLTAYNDSYGVVIRRLEPAYFRTLGIAIPRMDTASPIVKSFIQCAREVLQ